TWGGHDLFKCMPGRDLSTTPIWRSARGLRSDLEIRRSKSVQGSGAAIPAEVQAQQVRPKFRRSNTCQSSATAGPAKVQPQQDQPKIMRSRTVKVQRLLFTTPA